MSKRKKARWDCVCVFVTPHLTLRGFKQTLPGRFLGTNYICSHWTPSPDYRGLKQVLSSPLHPSDCQNSWINHPPEPIPSPECVCALCFCGLLPYSRTGCCFYQSCQGMHCFGLVLHCTAGSGEATVPWIEHLLPMSAVQDLYFNVWFTLMS